MCVGRAVVVEEEEEEDIVEDCAQDVEVCCSAKDEWISWTRTLCKGRAERVPGSLRCASTKKIESTRRGQAEPRLKLGTTNERTEQFSHQPSIVDP